MEKIYNASFEELEFYEFKLSLKKELLAKATDEEQKTQYNADIDVVKDEIRWI